MRGLEYANHLFSLSQAMQGRLEAYLRPQGWQGAWVTLQEVCSALAPQEAAPRLLYDLMRMVVAPQLIPTTHNSQAKSDQR